MLPEPVYRSERVTVYHGDCLDIMPHLLMVDAIVTDPPYGIDVIQKTYQNKKTKPGRAKAHKTNYDAGLVWDCSTPGRELLRLVCAKGCDQIIWGGNYFADILPASPCWLVWDKKNGSNDFADCELAWTSMKGAVRKIEWRWSGMLQENMGDKDARVHPTQKPVAVMRWCLTHISKAQTILDPFAGSGTTAIACIREGLAHCTLIEREQSYVDAAIKRIEAEEQVGRLF